MLHLGLINIAPKDVLALSNSGVKRKVATLRSSLVRAAVLARPINS